MTTTAAIAIEAASKTFNEGSADQFEALQEIDLHIEPGEFVSLIGPSGCGKSTLLRLIGDLPTPTGGKVTVAGEAAHQARLVREYAMVFQQATLYDWRSVAKNVQLPLEIMGSSKTEREDRADQMLDLVGLTEFKSHYPRQLSGACSSGSPSPAPCRLLPRSCSTRAAPSDH